MVKTYVEYIFELENESTYKVTIKDVKPSIEESETTALANMIIQKNCQYKGVTIKSLKKCSKFNLEEEQFI